MRKVIIADLDGTIANIDKRRSLSKKADNKMNWEKFFKPSNIKTDRPNAPVIKLLRLMSSEYEIVITSGRSDRTKDATLEWLSHNDVPYDSIYMRREGDYKPATLLKERMLKEKVLHSHCQNDISNIELVLDDRDSVVQMWRQLGLTCFQVAEGNF